MYPRAYSQNTSTKAGWFYALLHLHIHCRYLKRRTKARFSRRTFHEPNLIRINTNPNYLDLLDLIQTPILIPAELNSLCIRFGT